MISVLCHYNNGGCDYCFPAHFIFNREDSEGASLMSYLSSKDPVPMSPLNVSAKSDTPVMNFDVKATGISNMSDGWYMCCSIAIFLM